MSGFFLNHEAIGFTAAGELTLAGQSASSLAEKYGTPLIVLLEDVVRTNCRAYTSRSLLYPRSRIYYASKAFLSVGFVRLLMQEGLGLDVVSSGELTTALAAGMDPASILMHGNAKSRSEMDLAVSSRVGRIVVDNLAEIAPLAATALRHGVRQKVFLRVTPGIKPSTHAYVQTGQEDSKFGFNLAGGAAAQAARLILAEDSLELVGIHCHIGSQILDSAPFLMAVDTMMQLYALLKQELGAPLDELDIGGGVGIRYQPGDAPPDIAGHYEGVCDAVLAACRRLELEPPLLCDEPGRSIVGEAGVTLYRVCGLKRIAEVRNYAGLDGGMTDNPRFALYGARHFALNASRGGPQQGAAEGVAEWALAGKCCESGDMLLRDARIAEPQYGDIIAMFSTGAYTYSMASNYNRVPRPPVLLLGSSGEGLLCRRETEEDIMRLDETPEWLKQPA